jgi:hypothetical protein
MKIQWTSNLKTEEEKEKFQRQILAAKPVLERLDFLLNERSKAIDSIESGVEKYIQPGWSAIQAHYNGEKASIKYIRNLINLDQKERTDG